MSLGPECGHSPAGHRANAHPQLQSHWQSPTEALAPRARDWLGSQGEQQRLPRTRSPGFEREPKASSPHTSKGKPPCSSPGSSFSAGNSQGCLGPRCGMGWDGSPHAHPLHAALHCSKAPLSYSETSLCSTYILLGQRGRRKILPCRGAGGAARKGSSPCTGSPRDTQTLSPTAPGVKGESRAHSEPQALTQANEWLLLPQHDPALLFPFATTSTAGILCWGDFLFQTRFPLLTPLSQP